MKRAALESSVLDKVKKLKTFLKSSNKLDRFAMKMETSAGYLFDIFVLCQINR
jgi:hypothetical protein